MKPTPESISIATSINNTLLKKALAILSRRQILYKNMNVYSLQQLSKVIQQINQQQSLKINPTSITESDDHQIHPYDNMMSMSEVKLMASNNLYDNYPHKDNKISITTKSNATNRRKDTINKEKMSILDLLQDNQSSHDYITNCYCISKQQKQEQSAEIQAFRLIKQQEYQKLLLQRQSQQKKKPQIPINLNNQRVVYGYDSKLIKLQKIKERKSVNISQMDSNIVNLEDSPQSKKQQYQYVYNRKIPIFVTNKVNITEKQAEQQQQKQKQKQRRARKYQTSTVIEQPPTINIRMNPQSHKELQQAIAIKQRGVKISIDKRQFSVDRYNTSNRINRRLTRAQYMQIRSNQQIRQGNYRQNGKGKTQSEGRLKTDYVKQEKSSSNSGKKYKISFSTFYNLPKKDQSTIFTHNLQAKTQLLKQIKDKPFLFQTLRENSSSIAKQQQLSDVDRYNLLYLKYKGNPPQHIQQNLLNSLKSQQKMLRQAKSSLLTYKNENRSIKRRG